MLKAFLVSMALLVALAAPAQAIDYREGQAWSYKNRPGEAASLIYIARIDRGLGPNPIFHLYIDGLKLKNPLIEGRVQDTLPHVPISQEALDASVVELVQAAAGLPDISEGYAIWRTAFEKGQTGVFTIPVAQIVQHIEDAFNKPK